MADNELRISELNRIANNKDFNELVVNSKTTENDPGITKKIRVGDLLYDNIIQRSNLSSKVVSGNEIDDTTITRDKITNNTITSDQIQNLGIKNEVIDSEAITSRNLKRLDSYTADEFKALSKIQSNGTVTSNTLQVDSGNVSINGVNYTFPQNDTPQFFLKSNGSGNLEWAEAVPGEGTSLVFSEILPVGTILPWTSTSLPADGKWLACNGNTFVGADYPDLRDFLIASSQPFGSSTDSVNYYLPDLRGRVVGGIGSHTDVGGFTETFALGSPIGTFKHALVASEMQHRHVTGTFSADSNDDWYPYIASNSGILYNSFTYNSRWVAGEGNRTNYQDRRPDTSAKQTQTMDLYDPQMVTATGHNNIQPTLGLNYIIKAKKDDLVQYNPTIGPGLSALNGESQQANTLTLSSVEVGIKANFDDFTFNGSNALSLKENISLSAINFTDGSMLSSAKVGPYYAGDSSDNLPLVFSGILPSTFNNSSSKFTTVDLRPYMNGEGRRARVTLIAVTAAGATNVFARPTGGHGNINLLPPDHNSWGGWGASGTGTSVDRLDGGTTHQIGGYMIAMTDSTGKIDLSMYTSNGNVKVYLESYEFFN